MDAEEFMRARKKLGLSRRQMGDVLGGYSPEAVCAWESGRNRVPPAVKVLVRILLTTNL